MRNTMGRKILPMFILLGFILSPMAFTNDNAVRAEAPSGNGKFQLLNRYESDPAVLSALFAVISAKRGELKSHPLIEVSPDAEIHISKESALSGFAVTAATISDFQENPDGTVLLGVVTEFIDLAGRRDLAANQILYRVKAPQDRETISTPRVKERLRTLGYEPGPSSGEWTEKSSAALTRFQKDSNLEPTGDPDLETLKRLLGDAFPVIQILEMNSFTVYPKVPKHMVYILAGELTRKDPERFGRGFDSWGEVAAAAISHDQLRVGEKDAEFVLFVYLLDKVDPRYPVHLGFSSSPVNVDAPTEEETTPTLNTPRRYARLGKWPVLSESFQIPKVEVSEKLYVTLFINQKPVAEYRIR
jgi:hypothetical protein